MEFELERIGIHLTEESAPLDLSRERSIDGDGTDFEGKSTFRICDATLTNFAKLEFPRMGKNEDVCRNVKLKTKQRRVALEEA